MKDPVLLSSYDSEGEARVVESFLRANGFDVELMGTKTQPYSLVAKITGGGLRLMIASEQLPAAKQKLAEIEKANAD